MSQYKRKLGQRSPSNRNTQLEKKANIRSSETDFESCWESTLSGESSEELLSSADERSFADKNVIRPTMSKETVLLKMDEIKNFAVLLKNALMDGDVAIAFRTALKPLIDSQTENLQKDITDLKNTIAIQAAQIDRLDQIIKNKNVRITGLKPELDIGGRLASSQSCIKSALDMFNQKLGVPMVSQEVDDAYLIGKPNQNPTIILKFLTSNAKSSIMQQRTKLKGIQPPTYINDDLTKKRADLFKSARICARDKKIYSTWSRNGNIYFKKTQDSPPKVLNDLSDIDNEGN